MAAGWVRQNFRDAKRRGYRNGCRSSAMKNKHDLRCARFALEKTDFADFVEFAAGSHWPRTDCSPLRSFGFAATRKEQHDCKYKRRKVMQLHSLIWVQRHAAP